MAKRKPTVSLERVKAPASLDSILKIYLGGKEDSPGVEPSGGEARVHFAFPTDTAGVQKRCMEVLERVRSVGDAWSQSSAEIIAEQVESKLSEEFAELSPLTLQKLVNWFLYQWK